MTQARKKDKEKIWISKIWNLNFADMTFYDVICDVTSGRGTAVLFYECLPLPVWGWLSFSMNVCLRFGGRVYSVLLLSIFQTLVQILGGSKTAKLGQDFRHRSTTLDFEPLLLHNRLRYVKSNFSCYGLMAALCPGQIWRSSVRAHITL